VSRTLKRCASARATVDSHSSRLICGSAFQEQGRAKPAARRRLSTISRLPTDVGPEPSNGRQGRSDEAGGPPRSSDDEPFSRGLALSKNHDRPRRRSL